MGASCYVTTGFIKQVSKTKQVFVLLSFKAIVTTAKGTLTFLMGILPVVELEEGAVPL